MKPVIRTRHVQDFSGIASSARISREVTLGGTHLNYYLVAQDSAGAVLTVAEMKTEIDEIKVTVNGDLKIDTTATFLLLLENAERGADGSNVDFNEAGVVKIPLIPSNMPNFDERMRFAWGRANVSNITVEVKLGTVTELASLSLYAEAAGVERQFDVHRQIRKQTETFGSAGIQEITSIPTVRNNVAYNRLYVDLSSQTISTVAVEVDNSIVIFDDAPDELVAKVVREQGMEAMAGYLTIPFDTTNTPDGYLPTGNARDFRVSLTWGGAPTTYDIYSIRTHGLAVAQA